MNITKTQLRLIVDKAYRIGYNDRTNQEGYNIAVRELGIDARKHKRPKHTTKKKVFELATSIVIPDLTTGLDDIFAQARKSKNGVVHE